MSDSPPDMEEIPLEAYEARAKGHGNRVSQKPGFERRLAGIDFAEMAPHLTDGYLLKGLFTPNSLVGIIGPTGSGKTFCATDIAMHIAAGRDWRGHKARGGLVVYGALEGPVSAENRFVAAREHIGFPKGIPLRLTPGPLNLRDHADVAVLIAFVKQAESDHGEKCAAIFVDTLARALAGGDENGPEDMGALIAGADAVRLATGSTVILVHHMGKDVERGARGHSSFKAALDTEIEVMAKEEIHVATVTKQRDLPAGGSYPFRLKAVSLGRDEDDDPVTSCVVQIAEPPPKDRKTPRGKHQASLLAAILEWRRAHSDRDSISTFEFRALAKAQGIDRRRLQEAAESLERFGWLQSNDGGFKILEEPKP